MISDILASMKQRRYVSHSPVILICLPGSIAAGSNNFLSPCGVGHDKNS